MSFILRHSYLETDILGFALRCVRQDQCSIYPWLIIPLSEASPSMYFNALWITRYFSLFSRDRHSSWSFMRTVIVPSNYLQWFLSLALGSFFKHMCLSVLCWILKRTPSQTSGILFIQHSPLCYSVLWTLAALIYLGSQLCVFNSGEQWALPGFSFLLCGLGTLKEVNSGN